MYNNGEEFPIVTRKALENEPVPLSDELRHELSWVAATERFEMAAELNQANNIRTVSAYPKSSGSTYFLALKLRKSMEEVSAILHQSVSGIEVARCAFGAIPKILKPDAQQCLELGLVREHKPLLKH